MKPRTTQFLLITGVSALLVTGCYTRHEVIHERAGAPAPAVREVIVVDTPPAPLTESIGVAPSSDHVWVPGHWTRSGDRWAWTSGRWELRPSTTSIYVPGHWEKRDGGYVWREGYWK